MDDDDRSRMATDLNISALGDDENKVGRTVTFFTLKLNEMVDLLSDCDGLRKRSGRELHTVPFSGSCRTLLSRSYYLAHICLSRNKLLVNGSNGMLHDVKSH